MKFICSNAYYCELSSSSEKKCITVVSNSYSHAEKIIKSVLKNWENGESFTITSITYIDNVILTR